jgi:L-rhamnonate dehydratase
VAEFRAWPAAAHPVSIEAHFRESPPPDPCQPAQGRILSVTIQQETRPKRISAVRIFRLTGTIETTGPFWEERLVRPIDIYPDYRSRDDFEGGIQLDSSHHRLEQHFLRIETDTGPYGTAGPLPDIVALYVARRLRRLLIGQDPIAHEMLWDQMHRYMVHGRQGDAMLAISAVDCALWDLKGRWLSQPVYRLLGGPTRDTVPCWASMFSTWAACGIGRPNTKALVIQRRNGFLATAQ